MLLPAPTLSIHPNDTASPATIQPTWQSISRVKGRKYDAIFQPNNNSQAQYDFSGLEASPSGTSSGRNAWQIVPTNVVVAYTQGALNGKTYVYPAFIRWRYGNDPTLSSGSPTELKNGIITEGPFIAGDATGWGIADSALYKLQTTKSATWYVGIRMVDNASGINVNTALDATTDVDGTINSNCFNFFTTDVDLHGLLNSTSATNEMRGINAVRLRTGVTVATKPETEPGAARSDIVWRNLADAQYHQYNRRLGYPHRRWGDQTAANQYRRAFDAPGQANSDTAGLVYHGVMQNQATARSYFETQLMQFIDPTNTNPTARASVDRGALNYVVNQSNQFDFLPANNVGFWYDWNFNFDNIITPAGAALTMTLNNGMGNRNDGGAFRTPRGLLVASNPALNYPAMHPWEPLPASVKAPGAAGPLIDLMPSWTAAPHKASLNTAGFGELWRAYWNVIAEPATIGVATEPFHVPGVNTVGGPNAADTATNMWSNTLRDPQNCNSDPNGGRGMAPTLPRLRLDCYNMALLRSALAAVNTVNFRDSSGMVGTAKVGVVRTKKVQLQATQGAGKVNVTIDVFGNEAQPYITEVYVNTDISKNKAHADKTNPKGYIAVKLHNPYPFPLSLTGYQFGVINRNGTSASYPNLNLKILAAPTTALPSIAPNGYVIIENFDPSVASAGPDDAGYRPDAVGLNSAGATFATVKHLYELIDDTTPQQPGGELVIMRPLTPGVTPSGAAGTWAPADSYDFSGIQLMLDPQIAKPPLSLAHGWHYWRMSGATTATAWKFVYPGRYKAAGTPSWATPRHEGTKFEEWDPNDPNAAKAVEPYTTALGTLYFTGDASTACYPNPFQPIRLNYDMFSRSTKYNAVPGKNMFPFGGFARVGDLEMIPYIGAYVVEAVGNSTAPAGQQVISEANAITMDSSFADDGDSATDKYENIGRFCPITEANPAANGHNDYAPYGAYPADINLPTTPDGKPRATYSYHWAMDVFDNFTVISNPQDDYLPNVDPTAWLGSAPDAIGNGPHVKSSNPTDVNNGTEDLKPVEGLININTVPWQVLSRIQLYPRAGPNPTQGGSVLAFNQKIAQWIVRYRDVDGGTVDSAGVPVPHGPFASLLELNDVFEPGNGAHTFRNAFGNMLNTAMPDQTWGNYAVYDPISKQSAAGTLGVDWANETLMVTRISNLLTTRSDSFTAYILVQGWKNVGTAQPELIAQRRASILIDRSVGSIPGSKNVVTTSTLPTK